MAAPANAAAGSAFETYGDIGRFAIPTIAALIAFAKEDGEGLSQLRNLSAGTFGTVQSLKFGVDRVRPDGGSLSFPSGHTAGAFMGASYLHYRYGWKYGLPAYIAAAAVGASRVYAKRHYWTDVAAGAAIANVFAYFMVRIGQDDVMAAPIIESERGRYGVIVRFSF